MYTAAAEDAVAEDAVAADDAEDEDAAAVDDADSEIAAAAAVSSEYFIARFFVQKCHLGRLMECSPEEHVRELPWNGRTVEE